MLARIKPEIATLLKALTPNKAMQAHKPKDWRCFFFGGSWLVVRGVISPRTWAMTIVTLLIIPTSKYP